MWSASNATFSRVVVPERPGIGLGHHRQHPVRDRTRGYPPRDGAHALDEAALSSINGASDKLQRVGNVTCEVRTYQDFEVSDPTKIAGVTKTCTKADATTDPPAKCWVCASSFLAATVITSAVSNGFNYPLTDCGALKQGTCGIQQPGDQPNSFGAVRPNTADTQYTCRHADFVANYRCSSIAKETNQTQ